MPIPQSYIIVGLTILLSIIATVRSRPNVTTSQVKKYLSEFCYLPPSGDNSSNSGLVNAIKDFQKFANINITGELDEQTEKLILHPCCRVPDEIFRNSNRLKRFVIEGSQVKKTNLTYNIEEYPISLRRHEVDKEIQRAFSVWSEHTPLIFTRKYNGNVDFRILFVSGDHGDGFPFDGRGNVLAHAFSPRHGSKIHFDADEEWTIGTNRGSNLFQTAVHEIGHALGLYHSNVGSSVLAPFYRGYDPNFKLDDDDIDGIQHIYGKKSFQRTNLKPTLPQEPNEELCDDPKIDTIFKSSDGQIYVFKGEKFYKLAGFSIAPGYPKLISDGWPGLPGNIDAAFTYKDGRTYFFKDERYWQFTGSRMDDGFPIKISENFSNVPSYLDAAMYSKELDIMYFFKDNKFWHSNTTSSRGVTPKWKDIAIDLDAAFIDNNHVAYFFKDYTFYATYHPGIFDGTAVYPVSTKEWWFDCWKRKS